MLRRFRCFGVDLVLQELLHFEAEAGAERFLLDFGHLLNSGAEHAKTMASLKNRSAGNIGGQSGNKRQLPA